MPPKIEPGPLTKWGPFFVPHEELAPGLWLGRAARGSTGRAKTWWTAAVYWDDADAKWRPVGVLREGIAGSQDSQALVIEISAKNPTGRNPKWISGQHARIRVEDNAVVAKEIFVNVLKGMYRVP